MPNAIVFGATSGIGRSLSDYLIQDNYRIAISGRRIELLEEVRDKRPDQVIVHQLDVQDLDQCRQVFESAVGKLGEIDLIIHCSGIGYENPQLDWSLEADTVKTNVLAATLIYDLAFNLFRKQEKGHLVSVSSIASLRGNRHSPAYFASKAYQVNYLESLYFKSKEVKGGKIFITDIRPGYIDTRMALGDDKFWMSSLEKASRQIYKVIKRKKRRAYITRRWLLISWVLKIVPSWLIKKVM
ncbi:MAG: SDR family NAD(P)-dependent oxidoreductase [Flavobacteriaceae bacterium]|nr:SDR family NAD(P)-dependent oxidoreductase [Bacteroidia bacterium]NNK71430.1 SDR family NAD(P)-dependent oxidoreductase [Flavobacteriaceae bacterium]NNL80028.1 SDR family NAD(P)-dependent oxidoreductase [Flavobacteriaceae bacterium]